MVRKYFWIETSWNGGKWCYYKSYSSVKRCKAAISDIITFANNDIRVRKEDISKLSFRIVKSPYLSIDGDYSETYKYEYVNAD